MEAGRPTRRGVLRGAAAAAVAAAAGVLGGCRAATARPTTASPTVVLTFAPNWQGAPWNTTSQSLVQSFVDQQYVSAHRGLQVKVIHSTQNQAVAQIAASLAGQGFADVFDGAQPDLPTWAASGLLVSLDPYLQKSNIDTSIWSKRHVEALTFGGQIKALPSYDGPVVVMYRQDILDSLGLTVPDSSWTYADALQIWTSAAGQLPSGQRRYGVSLFQPNYKQLHWWLQAWGGTEADSTLTKCLANSAAGVGAMKFGVDLAQVGVAVGQQGIPFLEAGSTAFLMAGGWELLPAARSLGAVKWDILPVPEWPAGRATFLNDDFYGLNGASQHLDAAWELLQWVTAEPDFQRFEIKTTLVQPSLNSLWAEWETTVKSVAPPLLNKALQWFQHAATGGYAYPMVYFADNPTAVDTILDLWTAKMWSGGVSVTEGLDQMVQQVDAVATSYAAEASSAAQARSEFPVGGRPVAHVPAGL